MNPLKLQILRAAVAHDSLLDFMRYTWQSSTSFLVGRHTREITARLTRATSDYLRGISTYLLVTVPFRHGKSEIISRNFPPYFFGHNPDAEIILTTYGQELSNRMSKDARRIMRLKEYREVFWKENIRIASDASAVQTWEIEGKRGKFQATGIGGGSTGKGADVLIVDDYLKGRSEAESETIRNTQWDDFSDNLMTRLAPVHIVVILATPWHTDDIIGRIKNRMTAGHKDYNPDFPKFEIMKFPARDDQGHYLFPERFNEEWYKMQFATLGAYSSAALLQCEPTPRAGNMFRVENIRIADTMPQGLRWCRFWDLASTEKERNKPDPDYTSGALVAAQKIKGEWHVYVKDVRYMQGEAPARNRLIKQTSDMDGAAVRIGVESVAGYKDTYTILRDIIKNRIIVKINATKDKVVRCSELEVPVEAGHLYFLRGAWNQAVLEEFASFPAGVHDDKVDSIAGAFEMAKELNGPSRML